MMRTLAVALLLCLASAQLAQAGAWLREKGKAFTSSSVTVNRQAEVSTSIYLEYGLTEKLTLGVDANYGMDRIGIQSGFGTVFLRFPLGPTDGTSKWAGQLGLGGRSQEGVIAPAAEAGLSWGRGIQIGEKYGWAAVDGTVNLSQSPIDTRIKLDATIGLGFTDHTKGMFQVFSTHQSGDLFVKLAPSLLIQPGKGAYTLQIGAELPAAGGGEASLKLGIWRDF